MTGNLDEILSKIDILDVVSQYVKLRKAGKDYVGLCPFHQEKTPSFTVSREKQIFYCFGCHEGGNLVHFVMKYENLNFGEAIEALARQYGIKLSRGMGSKRSNLFDAMWRLSEYYVKNLKDSPNAMQYLLKRGINRDTIEEFRIGFSDRKIDFKRFLKDTGISLDLLMGTGIIRTSNSEVYDIFRGRIIIPIFDINRRIIGFGGRAMEKDALPKYINSPESSIYSKRTSLFGLDKTRKHISDADEVYIVEGYFDFISLYINGFNNIVATLGTSITKEQLTKLKNYTENITLMLDGDEAGVKSALRLIGLFSEMDINARVVILPQGHDPDSFIREQGKERLMETLKEKRPILDFYLDFHMKKSGVNSLEGRLSFIRSVMPYIENIQNDLKKSIYIKRVSELTHVEEHLFWDGKRTKALQEADGFENTRDIIGKKVIGILMNNPNLIVFFKEKGVMRFIKEGTIKQVLQMILDHYEKSMGFEVNAFINSMEDQQLKTIVCESALDRFECTEEELERILLDYLRHVEKKFIKDELVKITKKLSEAEKRGDDVVIMGLLNEKRQVLALLKK
ncbi:MAG TPA: DNA primase [Syntrophorhabdaceae bacterium]|nr:DNA primase [Syntrophorhabdaceae bacterium]HOT42854.1 DNA primase [Syntrophorhabdaceae bacterium]HPC66539.1 DNA primase [Syntrophorhabdaceae bacterium]HQK46133.1 DNA primase [Syntrophorhabdaceae bacterium]HRR71093.1 DNA primase [Syntrophorhabdaceae bacterium]